MSKPASNNPSGSWKLILLLIIAGSAVLSLSPVSAEKPFVTIVAQGDQSYYMGEKVVFSGMNTDSDSTYLFITGPNLPDNGGKLSSPQQKPVSGDPGSFTVATTKPDNTWEYTWYTSALRLDAGTYTIYAVTSPQPKDQFNDSTTYGTVGIVYKKPFIMAEISSHNVVKGQPFTVTGTAVTDGNPSHVQIWILGDTSAIIIKNPVNPDGSFTFTADAAISEKLPTGKNYLIVEHPMADKQSNFVVSGDYVRDLKLNNGTDLFRLTGPDSLQGSNAADALIAAISEREAHDATHTNDTYTLIPFQVTDAISATTGVTIAASGTRSYYQGEKVVFSGSNYDSDTTYLFITGPDTFIDGPGVPENGGKLTTPREKVVSGNPGSFDTVKTKADKSWEYIYYTHNLNVNAGSYTVYAVSQPKANDQLNGVSSANVSIILKKPFLSGEISPASISKGEPFTVRGTAEGDPPAVQIWIIGNNYMFNTTIPVNPDASFTFNGDTQLSGNLPKGQCYVIVQHAMQDNTFDIVASGDYVRNLQGNNGMILFKINGAGSLQGKDAADALIAALSDPENGDDTYTVIPFIVDDTGTSAPPSQSATTTTVQSPTQTALLPFALIGIVVLVLGIVMWKKY